MIRLVNFLLLIKSIINYNKKIIDEGKTPPGLYKICNCIRETFCLSYAIRKNNNLYIYFQRERVLVNFQGNKLKFLGPDERSQALLLLRAIENVNPLEGGLWRKSTPGIYIRVFSSHDTFINFLRSKELNNLILVLFNHDSEISESFNKLKIFDTFDNLEDPFFIIPSYNITTEDLDFVKIFNDLKDIKFLTLSRINRLEDIFLYINFQMDLSKNSN